MLDFIREQENADSKAQKNKNQTKQKETKAEDNKDSKEQFLTVDTQKKNLQKSTILLIVVVIIGMIGLFWMIKKGTPNTAAASTADPEQAQIDVLIAKLGGVRSEMSSKMDTILKKFYEFTNTKQIPADKLEKNPFRMSSYLAGISEAAQQDLESLIGVNGVYNLQLFSIIKSDSEDEKSCCVINDRILYTGDTISGLELVEIGENFVKLSAEGIAEPVILKMNEEN